MPRLIPFLLAAVVASAALVPSLAQAQAETEPTARLRLAGQPLWHGREDDLELRVRISNTGSAPLNGFVVQVAAFGRVTSRSALHQTFEGIVGAFNSYTESHDDILKPGQSTSVVLDEPVASGRLLGPASVNGVYPVTVSLFDREGIALLDQVTTSLIYYPERPETRVGIVVVVPLNDLPTRRPDLTFGTGGGELEQALEDKGWLTALLNSLTEQAGDRLHLAIAPQPRLVDELADMADGYRRADEDQPERVAASAPRARSAQAALRSLRELSTTEGVQSLLAPYSFVDLPTIVDVFPPELAVTQLVAQLAQAEKALRAALGAAPSERWLFAPAGRLDVDTLDKLVQLGVRHTFVSAEALEQPEPTAAGCPEELLSFSCAIRIDAFAGTTTGFQSDAALQHRLAELARGNASRLELQRFFAESALLREEVPGIRGRVVQVTVPSLWHPRPRLSRLLIRGLARAPWLRTLTPAEGLEHAGKTVERELIPDLPATRNRPNDAYFAAIANAQSLVDSFISMGPPDALREQLLRNILVGQSRLWWIDASLRATGEDYTRHAAATADGELSKLAIGGEGTVTLTSRRGTIQFQVFNDLGYPVELKIELSSHELGFDQTTIQQRFEPGTTPLTVDVTARASGIFPLEVRLTTPDDRVLEDTAAISVRSTEFNQVALGITVGALVFLVLFYVGRALRRRREPDKDGTAGAPSTT